MSRFAKSGRYAATGLLALSVSFALGRAAQADALEEVVVFAEGVGALRLNQTNDTGSRLGLTALQTPASVDVLSSDEMIAKGDYDALDAVTRATGLSANANPGNGGTGISARGFDGHGSIMTLFDGTRLYVTAGTVTFPADTWTLDSIEVLRGAGSVINGLGAIGASVNYVSKKPMPGKPGVDALLAVGSFGLQRIALGGGADLTDSLSWRLDGVHDTSDGYVDRQQQQRKVAAGSLLFQPSQDFSTRFSVDYSHQHDDSPYFGTPLVNGQASEALRKQNFNFADGFSDYRDVWARVHTEWHINAIATLRNDTYLITTKRQWQNLENYAYNTTTNRIDRDGESYYGIIHDQQQVGTRADVLFDTSLFGKANKLSVGADFNSIDLKYSNNWSQGLFYAGNSVPVIGWTPDTLATANIPTVLAFSTDTQQWGVFADNQWQVAPRWSVLLGARLDGIRYHRDNRALGGNPASAFDADYSEFSARAGVVYQPSSSTSIYGQFSRATDPVTSPITMSSGNKNFDPTRGRQWEVGFKQQLLAGMAEYSLAWFDIVKTGLVTRRPGSPISEQIGQQSSRGIEATLRANPTSRVNMEVNATRLSARYDQYFSGTSSYAGKRPNSIPKVTANAWVNYAPVSAVSVGGGVRYVGSRFGDDANTRKLPSYSVLDAKLSWNVSKQLQATVRVRNLTDEKHYVLSEYAQNQWLFGEPRAYDLSIRYAR